MRKIIKFLFISLGSLLALSLSGCTSHPPGDLLILLQADKTPGGLEIKYEVVNVSDGPIYIESGKRMPYLELEGRTLTLRYSVHPEPGVDYIMFELPELTKIDKGKSLARTVTLPFPVNDSNHFDGVLDKLNIRPGELKIQMEMGYGLTPFPLTESTAIMREFLDWQRLTLSPIVAVTIQ